MLDSFGQMIDAPAQERFIGWHTPATIDPLAGAGQNQGFSGDVLTPAFRQYNTVGSLLDIAARPGFPVDPTYDVTADQEVVGQDSKYFPYLDSFVGVRSKQETQAIMSRIDREQQDRQNIGRSGWRGYVAAAMAGGIDPLMFIPVAGVVSKGVEAGRIGGALLRAGEGAAIGGAATAAQQTILQGEHPTQTFDESLWNTVIAAALFGILGGGAALLTRPELDALHAVLIHSTTPAERGLVESGAAVNPLDAVGFNARLAVNGVGAADRPGFTSEYARINGEYNARRAQLEAIRTEAGQPRTAPEYVSELERLTQQHEKAIAELQAVIDDYRVATVQPKTPEPQSAPAKAPTAPQPEMSTPAVGEALAGAQGVSKIGKSIETKAVDARLTNGFEGTAGYDTITIKDQAERATKLVNEDLEKARAVVRGEEPPPSGLHGTALITAMEEHLKNNPSAEVAYELANSPLVSATSAAAQALRLAAERTPDSIAAQFQAIRDARIAALEKRGGAKAAAKKATDAIKASIVAKASKRPTWESFVKSIEC